MLTVIFEGDTRLIFSIGLVAAPPVGLSVLACLATAQLDLAWSALIVVLLDLLETTCHGESTSRRESTIERILRGFKMF